MDTSGCVTVLAGIETRYRPIVLVAHRGIYFSHNTYPTPAGALNHASDSRNDKSFRCWHFHEIRDEPPAQ